MLALSRRQAIHIGKTPPSVGCGLAPTGWATLKRHFESDASGPSLDGFDAVAREAFYP
jgi:hypothetical protein